LPHTKDNVRACCCLCNTSRGNRDFEEVKLSVQLRKFAIKNNLPMTIGNGNVESDVAEKVYHRLRNGITGGLSNVMHRVNIAGETKINHLYIEEFADPKINKQSLFRVVSKDSEKILSHIMGVDFNSLYPFSMGSIRRPWIQYDNGIMYMPAQLKEYSDDSDKARKMFDTIFESRFAKSDEEARNGLLMVASLKGHVDEKYLNEFINFPPIFRSININAYKKSVVGDVTYEQIKNVGTKRGVEKKLTQLLSTHDQFMTFSSYYLFYLIDRCHFIVDDIKEIATFSKTDCFNPFVTTFMNRRIKAIKQNSSGVANYCKMILNSSYGFDILNEE
jgi:hypothetical protein